MSDLRYFGDGGGLYAGTYVDLDQFREPPPPVPIMNWNMWECYRESLRSARLRLDERRPQAKVINGDEHSWAYSRPRLFFVEYMGIQYAIIEYSSDDAMNIVEYSERYQQWK